MFDSSQQALSRFFARPRANPFVLVTFTVAVLGIGCTSLPLDPRVQQGDTDGSSGDGSVSTGSDGGLVDAPYDAPVTDGGGSDLVEPQGALANGKACQDEAMCASGNCVDSVCCENACEGICESCAAGTGECKPLAKGTKDVACPLVAGEVCGRDGTCDGLGQCTVADTKTKCADASCAELSGESRFKPEAFCDGRGACREANAGGCGNYACGATGCKMGCQNNNECKTGVTCENGLCGGSLPPGAACDPGSSKCSGTCVDGRCCTTTCDGKCEACNVPNATGIQDGVCRPFAKGDDPENECNDLGAMSCGDIGACSGAGACDKYPAGTACKPAMCEGTDVRGSGKCDGQGTCQAGTLNSCGLVNCVGNICQAKCTADTDCKNTAYCPTPGGDCAERRDNGRACTAGNQCKTGMCADGFCCNAICDGECTGCSQALTGNPNGECHPVMAGMPDGTCPVEAPDTCGRKGCDGRGACGHHPAGTACGATSCSGSALNAMACTAAHQCASSMSSCGLILCKDTMSCGITCPETACIAGSNCVNGQCVGKAPDGSPCPRGNEDCLSGFCADGVCCNGACAGPCLGCTNALTGMATGVCADIPAGSDPQDECVSSAQSSCGTDGQCNGAGACRTWASGTTCLAGTCNGSVASPPQTCSGAGMCQSVSTTDCFPQACSGGACVTCTTDAQCASKPNHRCQVSTGLCKKDNGQAETDAGDCWSGQTSDGVCCNAACTGTCQACTAAKTGGTDGNCSSVASDSDPDTECTDEGAAGCGNDGTCNGAGACKKYSSGTVCVAGICNSTLYTGPRTCDGTGTCQAAPQALQCAPGTCLPGSVGCVPCPQCAAGQTCVSGECKYVNGQTAPCPGNPSQCVSGVCSDGVCCENACGGTCKACVASRTGVSDGTCSNVTNNTDPDIECAAAAASTCGNDGMCNGAGACGTYDAGTVCRADTLTGCDVVETCPGNGAACPVDGFRGIGTVCKTASGLCDVDDTCAGNSAACPTQVQGGGVQCRPANGVCDPADTCDGASESCPSNYAPSNTTCVAGMCAGTIMTPPRVCDGAGSCGSVSNAECSPYQCSGAACTQPCTTSANCVGTHFCGPVGTPSVGVCEPKLATPQACPYGNDQCLSGNCSSGICCNAGYKGCGGACILASACCSASDCTPPTNSTATCGAGTCGFTCNAGYKECSGACIGQLACCNCVVPANGSSASCVQGSCRLTCNPGYKPCNGSCVTVATCCGESAGIDVDLNGVADCTENLLGNGQFAANLNSWAPLSSTAGELTWITADGSGGTGSVRVQNMLEPGGWVNGATQCVRVSPSTEYSAVSQIFIPSALPANVDVGIMMWQYSGTNCTTFVGSAISNPSESNVGFWFKDNHTFTTGATTQSLLVFLQVTKVTTVMGTQTAYYDNALLRPGKLPMYLYSPSTLYTGNLVGRSGADSICASNLIAANVPCKNVRSFASFSATDEIQDMPTNYGVPSNREVRQPNGVLVDTSFAGLLDGSIANPLSTFGMSRWWTGSTSAGVLKQHCTGWTNGSSLDGGSNGENNQTGTRWLEAGGWLCNNSFAIGCMCW